jgi:hypothetical protein
MAAPRYIRSKTAVALVDPYNDFFSRAGPRVANAT